MFFHHYRFNKISLIFICILLPVFCQAEKNDYYDLDIKDLMDIEVFVTTQTEKGLTLRESPGIVSVITSEEIMLSGANDLMDILSLLPGFSFGVDVEGVIGVSMRGNWAHEGKLLFLLDGHQMNEISFGTFAIDNHIPADQIEKIEIIRGPGSAIYGGFAELGVINIITHKGGSGGAPSVSVDVGSMGNGLSRQNASFAYQQKNENYQWDISGYAGKNTQSNYIYTDIYGSSFDMAQDAHIEPELYNFHFQTGGLKLGMLVDNYQLKTNDAYDKTAPTPLNVSFPMTSYSAEYHWKLNDQFSLTPTVRYRKQHPWENNGDKLKITDPFFTLYGRKPEITRTEFELKSELNTSPHLNLLLGFVGFEDNDVLYSTRYNTHALFFQNIFKENWATITLGARLEDHNIAGESFVPRVGLTKIINDLHFKLLYSEAFRAPVSENFVLSSENFGGAKIKPEKTYVTEFEIGYQVNKNWFLTGNLFDININNPIVYYVDSFVQDTYRNYENVHTQGFEFEAKYKEPRGYLSLNGSYYHVMENNVDQYAILDTAKNDLQEHELLGMPPIKLTLNSAYYINQQWSMGGSLVYFGKKYGYTDFITINNQDRLVATHMDDTLIANINFIKKQAFDKNVSVSFGLRNLFNEKNLLVQPYYDGFHAPLPEGGREVYLKLLYNHPTLNN